MAYLSLVVPLDEILYIDDELKGNLINFSQICDNEPKVNFV